MVAALKFGKDANGFNAYAPRPCDLRWAVELDDSVEDSFTLPTDSDFYTVSFRYQPGTTVWVDVTGGIAEFPTLGTFVTTTSEMNPASLVLEGGATISMITGNTEAQVGVCAWQGPA